MATASASLTINGVVVATLASPTHVDGDIYRFAIPDSVALTTGEASLDFAAGTLVDSGGFKNTADRLTFTIQGPRAGLVLFRDSGLVGVAAINARTERNGSVGGYIDVYFETTNGTEEIGRAHV